MEYIVDGSARIRQDVKVGGKLLFSTVGDVTLTDGAAFVSTPHMTDRSLVFISVLEASDERGMLQVIDGVAEEGFTIVSDNNDDNSRIAWLLIEPYE